MIQLIPEDRYERVQRELRARVPAEPEPANVRAVMQLGARTFFIFRGRSFIAEPVPYRAGLRLQVLLQRVRANAAVIGTFVKTIDTDDDGEDAQPAAIENIVGYTQAVAAYDATVTETVEVIRHLARPTRMPRWLFRVLRPNSFQGATEREIGELLGFFLSLRTRSSVSIR